MKRIQQLFLILWCSFVFLTIQAQESIESLTEQIENSSGKRKVDLILDLATLLGDEKSEYETALNYCEEALLLAESLNYEKGEANAYRRIGSAYANMEEYPKAEEAYLKAQDLFQSLADNEGYYDVQIRKGLLAYINGDIKQSEKYLREAIDYFSTGDNLEFLGEAYVYLGIVYQNENRLDEASDNYSKAIELYRQIQSPDLANSLINLGDIYITRQDYQTALDLYLESLSLREAYEDDAVLSYLYLYISKLYVELTNYEKSIEYTQKALKIYQTQNDITQIINAQYRLSNLFYELSNFQEALNSNKELLDLYELSDSTDAYNATLVDIALCYGNLNNQTLAIQYYEKAKEAYQAAGDQEKSAAVLVNIAESYVILEEYEKAISFMKESIAIRENNPESSLENLYFSKANLLDFYNYIKDYEKVIEFGIPLSEEVYDKNVPEPEAEIYREIAIAFANLGQMQKAIDYRQKAFNLATQISDDIGIGEDYSFFISIYADAEDCEKVLEYCLESIPLYERLNAKEYLAGTFYNAGYCYFEAGDIKKGFAFWKKAFDTRRELGENEIAGIIAFQIGEKHQNLEEYAQAINYYEQAIELSTNQEDIEYINQFIEECRQKSNK